MKYSVRLGNKIPFLQRKRGYGHPANENFARGFMRQKDAGCPPALLGFPKGEGEGVELAPDNPNTNTQSPEPGVIRAMQTPGNLRRDDSGQVNLCPRGFSEKHLN